MLSACAMSDEQVARFVAVPEKYAFYSCDEIATEVKKNSERERELRQLMDKAGTGAGGQLIGNVAYGTDYTRTRGNLMELRAAAAEKKCNSVPVAADAGR